VKLKTLVSAAALALLAACSGDSTGPDIPALTPLPAGVTIVTTESGLKYADVTVGTGAVAQDGSNVAVHYTGWLTDGTKFDSSDDHPGKEPITFAYGAHRVITGWDTGFEGMRVGGKRRLYIPYQLAYGEPGRPGAIPPKADLIFDIELVAQSDSPNPPAAAPQPATPPPASTTDPTKPASTPPPASSDPEAPKPQQPQSR